MKVEQILNLPSIPAASPSYPHGPYYFVDREYFVILYEAPHVARRATVLRRLWRSPRAALRGWLSSDATVQVLESELDEPWVRSGHCAGYYSEI